jgi:predicted ATP-grasp superfamily ATP-dependent carboligase
MYKPINNIRTALSSSPVEEGEFTASISPLAAHQAIYDALVLDARLRQSLLTVRSLGRRGLRVVALGTAPGQPTFASRWCQNAFVFPTEEGTEAYMAYLEQLLDQVGARVLIASSDATIALIRRHRERLEQRVHIALAKEPALGIAVNKKQTLEVAERLGLSIPRSVPVSKVDEVGAALREVKLPVVVKPVESWTWDGRHGARIVSQLVTTAEEARHAVEELTRFGGTTLFQEYLSGRRESLSFFYANGEIYARYAFWGPRTNPPLGGIYVLRQSIAVPKDTGEQAERLVREIGLEGYCQVEFRRNSVGTPYLMEINSRLNLGVEIAVRAGVDFPYMLYQWASGEPIDRVKSYRVGGRMRYLQGDIATTVAALQQRGRPGVPSPARAIFDFCASFFMPTGYDYFDWKDPRPAWTATAGVVRSLVRRIGRGLSKRKSQ